MQNSPTPLSILIQQVELPKHTRYHELSPIKTFVHFKCCIEMNLVLHVNSIKKCMTGKQPSQAQNFAVFHYQNNTMRK